MKSPQEIYRRSLGNWNTAYDGGMIDIPPAIPSWLAVVALGAGLLAAGDELLHDGKEIDKLSGHETAVARPAKPAPIEPPASVSAAPSQPRPVAADAVYIGIHTNLSKYFADK